MKAHGAHRGGAAAAADRRPVGARRQLRRLRGPRLWLPGELRRHRPDRGPRPLVRPSPEGNRQRRRRGPAGADLRHGHRPVARRAGLAAARHRVHALLPAQRRRREHARGRRRAVHRGAGRRARRQLHLRPARPGPDDRRRDVPPRPVHRRQRRPARPAPARRPPGRADLRHAAARARHRGHGPDRARAVRRLRRARHRLHRQARRRSARPRACSRRATGSGSTSPAATSRL